MVFVTTFILLAVLYFLQKRWTTYREESRGLWPPRTPRPGTPRSGTPRSVATIATTFAAASVVASPASIPLLLVELRASTDGCPGATTCHLEPFFLWVALFAVGFLVIPAAFAASLRKVNAE